MSIIRNKKVSTTTAGINPAIEKPLIISTKVVLLESGRDVKKKKLWWLIKNRLQPELESPSCNRVWCD